MALWRDVVIRTTHSSIPVSNPDNEETLAALSRQITPAAAQNAFQALERSLSRLDTNVNTRLALESLLLELPTL